MAGTYRYLHLDVFTDHALEGNQLAVFVDARGLAPAHMQAIAREMAFPESTFIFPSDDDRADARMRIFTPRRELPMAGHPTIGSTFALASEKRIQPGRSRIVLALGIGPTAVDLEWRGESLERAWMSQPLPVFGSPIARSAELAAALGLRDADIRADLPVQEVSCGLPFLFVPVTTRQAVDASVADPQGLRRFQEHAGLGELGFFLFTLDTGDATATAYSRMFAPDFGVAEDPATGSASGPLGCYLVRHDAIEASRSRQITSRQGVAMGRPSEISVAIGLHGDEIGEVKVGGTAVIVGEGTLRVPNGGA